MLPPFSLRQRRRSSPCNNLCPAPVRELTLRWTLDMLAGRKLLDTVDEDELESTDSALGQMLSAELPKRRRGQAHDPKGAVQALAKRVLSTPAPSLEAATPVVADLGRRLGLDPIETQLLCALTVRDVDTQFGNALDRLEPYLGDDVALLAEAWTGHPASALRQRLQPGSALVGFGLVDGPARLKSASDHCVHAEVILLAAAQETSCEEFLAGIVRPAPPAQRSMADFPHLASVLPAWLALLRHALATRRSGVNLLLHGAPGTGKTELCRLLAAELGADLVQPSTHDRDGHAVEDRRLAGTIRLTQRALRERTNTLLLVDEAEAVLDVEPALPRFLGGRNNRFGGTHKAWLIELLESTSMPTLWVANDLEAVHPAVLRRFDLVLNLQEPPVQVRRRMLDEAFGEQPVGNALRQRLAELPGLQPGHAQALGRLVHSMPEGFPLDAIVERQASELRGVLGLKPLPAHRPAPLGAFRLDWIHCDRPLEPLLERMPAAGEGRFFIYGSPGTGKSAFAAELAARLGRPLQARVGGDLLSCYVGETEKAIARTFREAQANGSVLLIDEIEGVLSNRQGLRHSWELGTVNALLTALDAFQGYVVLTTNLFERMDPALLRRMEHKLEFAAPTAEQRRSLWRRLCEHFDWDQGGELEGQVDALEGLTPGDFHQVARQYLGAPGQATPFAVLHALRAEHTLKARLAA